MVDRRYEGWCAFLTRESGFERERDRGGWVCDWREEKEGLSFGGRFRGGGGGMEKEIIMGCRDTWGPHI